MPRFFFDVNDARGYHHDTVGDDFPDAEAARSQAIRIAESIACEEMPDGDRHRVEVLVRDEADEDVYWSEIALSGRWVS